jgi:hypothetical protein
MLMLLSSCRRGDAAFAAALGPGGNGKVGSTPLRAAAPESAQAVFSVNAETRIKNRNDL